MTLDPKALEAAAIELASWARYDWEYLDERDISDRFPDWASNGIGHLHMQGGRPAVRKAATKIITAYLSAITPPDVAGLVARLRMDEPPTEGDQEDAADALERLARERDEALGRLCVCCDRTLPASHDHTKAPIDCATPEVCTIDLTMAEAVAYWRRKWHEQRTYAEAAQARIAVLDGALDQCRKEKTILS